MRLGLIASGALRIRMLVLQLTLLAVDVACARDGYTRMAFHLRLHSLASNGGD